MKVLTLARFFATLSVLHACCWEGSQLFVGMDMFVSCFWGGEFKKEKKTLPAQDSLRDFVSRALLVLNLDGGKNTADRNVGE